MQYSLDQVHAIIRTKLLPVGRAYTACFSLQVQLIFFFFFPWWLTFTVSVRMPHCPLDMLHDAITCWFFSLFEKNLLVSGRL